MKEVLYVVGSFVMALWSIGLYHVGTRFFAERSDIEKVLATAVLGAAGNLAPLFAIGWAGQVLGMPIDWRIAAMACWLVPLVAFVAIRLWKQLSP